MEQNSKWKNEVVMKTLIKIIKNGFLKRRKKIFLIDTAEHNNIGDSAIAQSMINFATKYYKDYKIVEISVFEYFARRNILYNTITAKDMIWIAGGGNLGNVYINEELVRRDVIANIKQNKIFIFPQSIYFTEDQDGEREAKLSSEIYNSNPNLTLFIRDKISFEISNKIFNQTKRLLVPDIVCSYDYNKKLKRDGILCCIRDINDESGLNKEQYDSIMQFMSSLKIPIDYSKNLYKKDVIRNIRASVVKKELDKFARHKLIVTDRLHGLIFAIVTATPCVVLKSQNHKITGFYDFLRDCQCVKYINNLNDLSQAIQNLLKVDKTDYPDLKTDFDNLKNLELERCDETRM